MFDRRERSSGEVGQRTLKDFELLMVTRTAEAQRANLKQFKATINQYGSGLNS